MKTIAYIIPLLLIFSLFQVSCSDNDNEEAPYPYAEERSAMADSTQIGIYKEGKALLKFDKSSQQYYCNTATFVFRIQDSYAMKRTTLTLSGMPTEKTRVGGRLDGNMGVAIGQITDLYILKRDSAHVWLWSDADRVAVILPDLGF